MADLELPARNGNIDAQVRLALSLPKEFPRLRELWLRRAASRVLEGQRLSSSFLYYSDIIDDAAIPFYVEGSIHKEACQVDYREEEFWLRESAVRGNPQAMYYLAALETWKKGDESISNGWTSPWLATAAYLGEPNAMITGGKILINPGRLE